MRKLSSLKNTLCQYCFWLARLKTKYVINDQQQKIFNVRWDSPYRLAVVANSGDKGQLLKYTDQFNREREIDDVTYNVVYFRLNYLYYHKFRDEVWREQAKAESRKLRALKALEEKKCQAKDFVGI